ncbi:MAG: MMPL family transporter, partial [Proteobacteria bacterium]|nr:MMPL family transporter [Pseudomonadota bacterium]
MSQSMSTMIKQQYRRWVIDQPLAILALIALVVAASLVQIPKTTLDASADSLLLQGDPSLADFRDVSDRFGSAEFLLLTWQPASDLLSEESLEPLAALADELRALEGVRSVVTVLDVPLLESPPLSLSDVTGGSGLPTLSDPTVDRGLALKELTTSPIYSELLASQDGRMTAVQVNLEPFEAYDRAISRRESLRVLAESGPLSQAQQQELTGLAQLIKASSAEAMETRSALVADVRQLADQYRQYADIFVGGVPMIASDMVSFVRSDLIVFGAAILGVMVLVLGAIFRRVRWVVIPLATCIVTVTVTLGILAALDWRMTVISSNFVAVLLVVALSIAIHLVVRYREIHRRSPELSEVDRIEATMAAMAVPCIYTGLTTIVAFLSLLVSRIQPVIDFGAMMSVGIVLALLFAFTLVPSLMRLWPAGKPVIHASDEQPFTRHFARWVDERGGTIVSVTVVLIALVGVGISQLKVENRFIDYFKQSTEIYQGMELLDAQLGGTIGLDITLLAPAEDASFDSLFGSDSSAQQVGGSDSSDDFFTDDDPFAEPAKTESAASPDDFDEFAFDQDPFSDAVDAADQP